MQARIRPDCSTLLDNFELPVAVTFAADCDTTEIESFPISVKKCNWHRLHAADSQCSVNQSLTTNTVASLVALLTLNYRYWMDIFHIDFL